MKKIETFENKKVLVLGLAKSGEAAARLLEKLGAIVTVNDGKPFDENPAAQSLLEEGIKVICGSHPLELLDENFELMVKNPGIRYDNPMVARAIEKNIPVITEVELAYMISDAPIIGITGSNGKTTTTTMIAETLNNGGKSGLLSGNIGFPASEVAQTATDKDTLVMELSSFQLMGTDTFHPHMAVITNLMPTHIDYHGSFEEYVAAKWNIQKNMTAEDYLVLNFNQDLAKELAQKTAAQVIPFSTTEKVDGAYLDGDTLYFKDEAIMKASEIGEVNGIKFYNDSKSTNILATQKALSGFDNSKVILIAGGLDRGNEFDELVTDITGVKLMVILGESAPRVKRAADKAQVPYVDAKDVADAARIAYSKAEAGDVVLLSPANASWDMYKSFEVRGDEFIATFEAIKGE